MPEEWKFVPAEAMVLQRYRCGVSAGDELRLRRDLSISDENGPTGVVHLAGEVWQVLKGNPEEAHIVWLRSPNAERQTWDDETLLDWFEPLSHGIRNG